MDLTGEAAVGMQLSFFGIKWYYKQIHKNVFPTLLKILRNMLILE